MSRPKKQTVDYFPHDCNHKTTIYILEQKYGNNGYAFWFKLLELLGATEGHVYDCRKPHKWEFLQAKTRLSEDTCEEILNLLAKLEAIDPKLWSQKVIWSDNFILRIEDVYKNRRVEIPTRPSFYRQKPTQAGVSTDRNPQTKLKETKLKETKRKPRKTKKYADFVFLTEEEYGRLKEEYGEENTKKFIDKLNNYKGSHGKKYKDDNLTIRNWVVDEVLKTRSKAESGIDVEAWKNIGGKNG